MSARTVFGTPHVPHPDTPVTRKQTSTGGHPVDTRVIIEDAICFANQTISEPANGASRKELNGGESIPSETHERKVVEYQDPTLDEAAAEVNNTEDANLCEGGDVMENVCNTVSQIGSCSHPADNVVRTPETETLKNTSPPILVDEANPILENDQPSLAFPKPSFSLGLTQEDANLSKPESSAVEKVDEYLLDVASIPLADNQEQYPANRKSKRQKVVPMALVGDYQCDKRVLTRAWEAHVTATHSCPNIDYAAKIGTLSEKLQDEFVIEVGDHSIDSSDLAAFLARSSHLHPKVIDVLIHHTRMLLASQTDQPQNRSMIFLDTKFVSLLSKTFAKFTKSKKESFRFPAALIEHVGGACQTAEATRIYFPFNFDKKHWVGVCVDSSISQVLLLDCNTSLRTDAMINKELRPISEMFPYLMRRGLNRGRCRGESLRGLPKFCRCGEEATIKTSGTAKNPGRLFYCCPNGSEGDKCHLFSWTDERVVEEVEDLKSMVSEIKAELSGAKADILELEKRIEHSHVIIDQVRNGCCAIL
ncbi:hypothetical protein Bca52824_032566 [Brassica carinata]|uniref:Ubiquitin-like protease family profile domain-containing protein n=1 Tax=Brassica carinata TaxID=52824 RepID=A0A8X7V599_BRACI|nr:hypothetical protein Bca52824_032566 [Brassica carinata]